MSNLANEKFIENAKEDFWAFMEEKDYEGAQKLIDSLKAIHIEVSKLQTELNTALSDEEATSTPDDYTNSTIETYGL